MNTHYKLAESLSKLLDNQFKIFGIRFGLDPIIGLVPGIGDVISFILSLYIIWISYNMKIPQSEINKMIQNIIVDLLLGLVPVLGDVSDFFYKANAKNMEILRKYAGHGFSEGIVID